ncbi:MAG: hypothetical protein RIB60_01090 [Phycisphaerales bacterium]
MERLSPAQSETLRRYTEHAAHRPETLGVVLSGSLVRGWGSERSDVDVIVLETEGSIARRRAACETSIYHRAFAAYDDGAVDAKYVDRAYLDAAAEKGSEATRNAFVNARVVFSRDDALAALVERIGTFPEAGVGDRLARFGAQLETCRWFIGEADKRSNRYLQNWVATRAVLFACRMILAHNRVIFPFHKWMLQATSECPDKPAGLLDAIDAALREPGVPTVHTLCDLVQQHRDWPEYPGGWAEGFLRDTERMWMRHEPQIEDV